MAKNILKPTLREKKRYVLFEVISKQKQTQKEVEKSILNSCTSYLGEKGFAQAGIRVMNERWNNEKQTGIIRVQNKFVNDLKASLALTKMNEAIIRSVNTSGIIKKTIVG